MATQNTVQRAGKSLLKYFRPIRTGNLGAPSARAMQSRGGFRLLRQRRDEHKRNQEQQPLAPKKSAPQIELPPDVELVPAPKDGSDWLGVVVHLLSLCKKASQNMGRRTGANAYKKVQDSSLRQKMRIVGSIINVTNQAEFDMPEENAKITASQPEEIAEADRTKPRITANRFATSGASSEIKKIA